MPRETVDAQSSAVLNKGQNREALHEAASNHVGDTLPFDETDVMARLSVALLNTIGRSLYGDRYQSQLARELDVHDRTMRRWLAGDFHPSDEADTIIKLRGLLAKKIAACQKMIERLDKAT